MVRAEKVNKHYGTLHVLKDVSLEVPAGSVTAIIGPSGSGKSTLLRCINYLERIESGKIWVDGQLVDPRATDIRRLRQEVGFTFQSYNLFPHLTVMDNVTLALRKVKGLPKHEAAEIGEACLGQVGLAEKLKAFPDELSGGQQQRVAIARSLAMKPKLMLFDEVTSALDPELIAEVLNVIRQVASEGMTMVLVTHEIAFAREIASQLVFMHSGRVLEVGSSDQVLGNPQTEECKRFVAAIL